MGRELAKLILPEGLHDLFGPSFGEQPAGVRDPAVNGRVEIEARRVDGSVFPAEMAIKRIELEKAPIFAICICDITERKRWERELLEHRLRLRELAVQLLRSEERERRRIAGQLHDNIGQLLAVVKIDLELLCQDEESTSSVRESAGTPGRCWMRRSPTPVR